MSLESLGQVLKEQRQTRGISLMDIATETRINLKFLEAMEQGNFSILPQTYVRAFIREYASIVGLNPNEIMEKYEASIGVKRPTEPSAQRTATSAAERKSAGDERHGLSDVQRKVVLGLLLVAAVAVAVFLLSSSGGPKTASTTQEIPFDRVVKETEAATMKPDTASPAVAPMLAAPAIPDSLHLEMTTTDSVWISITPDSRKNEQYLIGANRHRAWTAKDQFVISMGNAGGATFRLNGRELGALGKRGGVVRNSVINQATLKNL